MTQSAPRRSAALLAALSVLAATARAQGGDDCAAPTAISGLGTFPVATTGATDSTQQGGVCVAVHNDVWFRWTAPASGSATLETCGGATVDTVAAAWTDGGCSSTPLACNDDSCALQSRFVFTAVAGTSYLLQLGTYSAATTFVGSFSLSMTSAPAHDECATPVAISGAGPFPFDNSNATTGAQGQANSLCGNPQAIVRDLWYTWTANASGSMEVSLCGGAAFDTKVAVYSGSGCPAAQALGCNDDSCGLQSQAYFSAIAGNTYTIQLGSYQTAPGGAGTFTIAPGNGGCPQPSVGPDLIVGQIGSLLNTTPNGALDAFAAGMTACNIGDTVANWWAQTPQHPVIGSALYRLKTVDGADRMEQVGISWLKHGFGAATENACCVCQNPGNYQTLGVGCADTYSAGLNGTQSSLGPRWQVDASTGVFPYPPANPPWSGSTARRCEVLLTDLEATGAAGAARYFVEGVYVSQDDAAAGNNHNNATTRELGVTIAGGDATFALAPGLHRSLTAVEVWAHIDPQVRLGDVRVPGDGRVLVASRATQLAGGVWRYEYAVHNMNSGRNVGSFTVPLPYGATISNIGFHDIAYRNGDGPGNVDIDGLDWPASVGPGGVTWTCAPEALNPRANCIRWGSTYNFRFDCAVAPASGQAAFGLWKSGTPGLMAAAADVPGNPSPVTALCFGDGSGSACPCGNGGGAGAGCRNSLGSGGVLGFQGAPSVTQDTFTLTTSGLPDSPSLYFQGTLAQAGGAGSVYGDGLRCVAGTVVRLGVKTSVGGGSSYPAAGDPSVSARGFAFPGAVRWYQCWYRNSAAYCMPEGFNLTNALRAGWLP